MKSKNKVALFLVLVAFGLVVGPISFFFRTPTNPPQDQGNGGNPNPPPIKTIEQYFAQVTATVVNKTGRVEAVALSNYTNVTVLNQSFSSIPGAEKVLLDYEEAATEGGEYLYNLSILTSPSLTEQVGYFLSNRIKEFNLSVVGVSGVYHSYINSPMTPARLALPPVVNATSSEGKKEQIALPGRTDAYARYYTGLGKSSSFQLVLTETGGELTNITAFELPGTYTPPVEEEKTQGNVTVLNVSKYGLKSVTSYGTEVNTTSLRRGLKEQGANVSVSFKPPSPFLIVNSSQPQNLSSALNESGFQVKTAGNLVQVGLNKSLNHSVENVSRTVLNIDSQARIDEPQGLLTVTSPHRLEDFADLIPGTIFQYYSLGYFRSEEYNKTVKGQMPVDVEEGSSILADVILKTVFGELREVEIHPVVEKEIETAGE